jgi:uncharacterized protein (DUF1330 family)
MIARKLATIFSFLAEVSRLSDPAPRQPKSTRARYFQRVVFFHQSEESTMNRYVIVGLAMLGGAALGAATVQTLHAQAKPLGYIIAEVDVKDKDAYAKEFLPAATKAIEEGGGKYIVRGGKTMSFMGAPPASRVVVFHFENMEKAQAWWDSPGRKNSQTIGDKYATFRIFAIEGASP